MTLRWDANTEPDLAGYVVLYGTQTGAYHASLDVGNVTTYTIGGLTSTTTYYFAVRAYNSSGARSTTSAEVSGRPSGSGPGGPGPNPPGGSTMTLTSVSPASGPKTGGTQVTLTGTNFTSGLSVAIGGVPATGVTFVNATTLKATTPAGAVGGQNVTILKANQQGLLLLDGFTYTGKVPKLVVASPTSGPLSGGTELRLTGQNLSDSVGVVVGGRAATRVTHVSATSMLALVPARSAAGLVDVSLVEAGQVQSTLPGAFRYMQITSLDDSDGDGLPNAWEAAWGLNPDVATGSEGAAGDPDHDGVLNIDELQLGSHPRGFAKRYFAEGVVNAFFDTRLALSNPQSTQALVLLEFLDLNGETLQVSHTLPPRSRRTIVVRDIEAMADRQFSTRIESDQVIVADRLMEWDATRYGSHAETAVSAPSITWFFSEGATHGPYELYYLLQNPNDAAAEVDIRYLRSAGDAPIVKSYQVAAHSRATIRVDTEDPGLEATDVSAEITSTNDVPIIVERSMYLHMGLPMAGGHTSSGVTEPAHEWFLAEGSTGAFFSTYVLLANPGNVDTDVRVTYLLDRGAPIERTYRVAANSRFNINVNNQPGLSDVAFAARVVADEPIIVERSMWWPGTAWTEGSNSFGVTSTGTTWALAEGEWGGPQNTNTYVLIANTSPFAGEATVTLMFEDAPEVSRTVSLPANSRVTVDMDGPFAVAHGKRFATLVESLGTEPAQIVVERAMYSDARGQSWASGSNAVATKLR